MHIVKVWLVNAWVLFALHVLYINTQPLLGVLAEVTGKLYNVFFEILRKHALM